MTHPSFVVSVIIQPTSMGKCILRTSLFTNKKHELERSQLDLPTDWNDYMQSILSSAHTMQKKSDELTAPGAPTLTVDMIPIETSQAGYAFNQYLTKLIEIEHEYYWNAPLYSNNIRR